MNILLLLAFFALNFAALGIGGILIGNPATNDWYIALNKAPWTPPGWVFGAAWTSIMVCYSLFMWKASGSADSADQKLLWILFAVQWILNVFWNPVFFRWHFMLPALVMIVLLTALVGWFLWYGFRSHGAWGLLMLPYFIWLLIATSLNGYALLKN